MALSLPLSTSPIRDLFDIRDLADRLWVTLPAAKSAASKMFADGSVSSVHCLVLRACGNVELIRFGPKGGRNTVWKFGLA
jgi:hypothetical protein